MVLLRRKQQKEGPPTSPEGEAEHHESPIDKVKKLKHEVEELKTNQKSFFLNTRRMIFLAGLVFGTALALAFIEPSDVHDFHAHMSGLVDHYDITLPDMPEIDFTRLQAEWTRFRNSIPDPWKFNNDGREFQVGEEMKARGLTAQHPVVLIPGVISTSLESWSTTPDYRAFFRQRLWGGFNMITQVTFNKQKWIAAMMLDPITGLDPPGAKIRAAEGIDAASSFIQGFWIWSKIVENLAVVNYDTNNLYLAPYDWRLSFYNLEERDGYFSRLKTIIEGLKRRQRKKVVIAAHSMGANVFLYFCKWVESPEHGQGGSDWVENHIEAYISIAGTHLVSIPITPSLEEANAHQGVAKAMAAFLSGEMKDTVQMNPAGAYVLERFFSRQDRQDLFRSWAGSASMWIKGGDTIWGNATFAPDDPENAAHTHGELIAFRDIPSPPKDKSQPLNTPSVEDGLREDVPVMKGFEHDPGPLSNMTANQAGAWILDNTPSSFQKMIATNYSFGMENDVEQLKKNNLDFRKWSNPLEVQLPIAPSMKIYCVYGHGKETERSYWYARGTTPSLTPIEESHNSTCDEPSGPSCKLPRAPAPAATWIDSGFSSDGTTEPRVKNGVKLGEGDGTVSLLSLGAMCVDGWKRERWNPAGIKVTTVELPHHPDPAVPRGGANTSDHVDVLGSSRLNEIILQVATGVGHEVGDSFVSNIREYSGRINWDG